MEKMEFKTFEEEFEEYLKRVEEQKEKSLTQEEINNLFWEYVS